MLFFTEFVIVVAVRKRCESRKYEVVVRQSVESVSHLRFIRHHILRGAGNAANAFPLDCPRCLSKCADLINVI